jgi:ABC-2 type transport system ATP-binding protein
MTTNVSETTKILPTSVTPSAELNALSMKGVVKRYRGFTLGPLDLELAPGVVLGLIGPNGAGKTTTINILAGLVKCDAGSMNIFGIEHNLNNPRWKFDIGYVGDMHCFYEYWSGKRNLEFIAQFYPKWSWERVNELANRFNLDLKKRAYALSRGNRAKLALIGALSHKPRLLLLDEPTSGLDPVVRAEFLDTLWELMEDGDSAVLYSTHILSDISRLADDLVFLKDGKIVLRAGKDELVDKWRRISFKCLNAVPSLMGCVSCVCEGTDYLAISSDKETTLSHLKTLKAEGIEESCMTIEEIAVQILKESSHVEVDKK